MTGAPQSANAPLEQSQRLDIWLWRARFFKTRGLATDFSNSGSVRLTRAGQSRRVSKASFQVRPGDELCFTRHHRLCIVYVLACAPRRGPASEAQMLYEDRSPTPEENSEPSDKTRAKQADRNAKTAVRDPGTGRPTKRDRRAMAQLKANHD